MFGDDSFGSIEDLFNQLSGGARRSSYYREPAQNQEILSTVEIKKGTILTFDLSGKKVSSVEMQDESGINEYGERVVGGQGVIVIKFSDGKIIKYNLPRALSKRKMEYVFNNGILEVLLKK